MCSDGFISKKLDKKEMFNREEKILGAITCQLSSTANQANFQPTWAGFLKSLLILIKFFRYETIETYMPAYFLWLSFCLYLECSCKRFMKWWTNLDFLSTFIFVVCSGIEIVNFVFLDSNIFFPIKGQYISPNKF